MEVVVFANNITVFNDILTSVQVILCDFKATALEFTCQVYVAHIHLGGIEINNG